MLCRLFFQIYIKIKTEITEIDIAEGYQRTDNQKLKLILLILISLNIGFNPNPETTKGTY